MFKSLMAGAFLVTATATPAAQPAAETSDKIVCKKVKESTGWRLSNASKVCKKRSEWEAEARESQRSSRRDTRSDQ